MMNDFIDPDVAAYFASMQDTSAMRLYERWKAGKSSRVSAIALTPEQVPVECEIVPVRFFESGPVVAVTILVEGRPVPGHTGLMMSDSEFLDWASSLEIVEERK